MLEQEQGAESDSGSVLALAVVLTSALVPGLKLSSISFQEQGLALEALLVPIMAIALNQLLALILLPAMA